MSNTPKSDDNSTKWHRPSDVMKLQKLKLKKKALQARINCNNTIIPENPLNKTTAFEEVLTKKRKNPFIKNSEEKRAKTDPSYVIEESSDQTLFKLFNPTTSASNTYTSFSNILKNVDNKEEIQIVKALGRMWLPIDWTLKSKMRLLSSKPFPWNQKLKISEEASGITAFARCLDKHSETTLDTSPNAKFHQCCLYWQQPSLPWMSLFPRTSGKTVPSIANNLDVRNSLQAAWSDSLRSLFQLIRTRQCPFFYACANNFTVLFRAAGICGYTDVHVMITPTTRGFRHMLKQEDIEFTMPLKKKRYSDQGYETLESTSETCEKIEDEEEPADENWLKSMGIDANDIKQINYTQAKIVHKAECEVDNSEQSLVLVEGVEVHSFYNFLINCKSAVATTGPFAGVPPTLLAPVAFHGATLNTLKVRENKVHIDDVDYYSIELSGPILPNTIHNLFGINSPDFSLTATFHNISSTETFSKLERNNIENQENQTIGNVFGKENLSDCGLNSEILKRFCSVDPAIVANVECLKYTGDNKTYTWT